MRLAGHFPTPPAALLALWIAVLAAVNAPDAGASTPSSEPNPSPRVFLSGHSLMADPFLDYLASVSTNGAGAPAWDRQYLEGSTIRQRWTGKAVEGRTANAPAGIDRHGLPIRLMETWNAAEPPFDTLVITERNGLLGEIMWSDSARALRRYHQRFHARTPVGKTYFFEPWFTIDQSDMERWIAFERASSPVWGCLVAAVNASLPSPGDRPAILSIPVGRAVAELVDQALSPQGVAGITGTTRSETLSRLFLDTVHPTRQTAYFVALVVHARMRGVSPQGVWIPPDMPDAVGASLQEAAATALSRIGPAPSGTDLARCADNVSSGFQWTFWRYINDRAIRPEQGFARSWITFAKHYVESRMFFRRNGPPNPLSEPSRLGDGFWDAD